MEFSVLYRVVLGGIPGRNGYKNRLIIRELSAYRFILLGQGFYPFYPRWSCLLEDWVESALRWLSFSVLFLLGKSECFVKPLIEIILGAVS